MNDEPKRLRTVEWRSILSHRTREGMVELRVDGEMVLQVDVAKARELHRMMGEAIEAAVSDAMIFRFLRERVGLEEGQAVAGMAQFRELRQGSRETVFPQ
jgi:hypothetical protein